MKKLLMASVGAICLGFAAIAEAAPNLSMRVFEDNVLAFTSPTSATGDLLASGTTPSFQFVGSAFGSPDLVEPSFLTQATQITSGNFEGTRTIRLEFTQTGLNSATAGGLAALLGTTFTANYLTDNGRLSTMTLSSFVSASDIAYDRATPLATRTVISGETVAGMVTTNVSLPNPTFSETVVISATFTGGGVGGVSNSVQIVAVPEPASMMLLGTALLGLGLVRRARRQA